MRVEPEERLDELARGVIVAAIEVHRLLGRCFATGSCAAL